MFGSRLRSWMETHIRPRKRNNKNKQGNGNIETTKKEAIHLHGNGISTATTSTTTVITSNGSTTHCCGNGVVASPVRRREVSPIQSHSRYGWQSPESEIITSPKSDNFLYAPKHHRFKHEPFHRHQFDSKNEQSAPLGDPKVTNATHQTHPQLNPENSSSSFSSLSWSTGSKADPSGISIEKPQQIAIERSKQLQVPIITYHSTNDAHQLDEDTDAVHYEEIPTTILRQHDNTGNRNFIYQERPKSEQLTTFTPLHRQSEYPERRSIDDASSVRYGKLLPSRIQSQWSNRCSSESIGVGSAECLRWQKQKSAYNAPVSSTSSSQHYRFRNGCVATGGAKPSSANNLKGNAIPLNSLSSPESAYSTGYSTDGTSPGACYNQAPEYYINMRTGTHYFPKSVNSLAIETQRCKFGLNKIEEMSPIDPLPKTTFASACNKISNPNIYACPGSPYQSAQGLDMMRNSAIMPTLQGYESSSPRQRCRIRTNPWVTTHDSLAPSGTSYQQLSNNSTTSSTVCSSRISTSSSVQADAYILNNEGCRQHSNDKRKIQMGRSNSNSVEKCIPNGTAMYDSSSSLDTEDTKPYTMSLTEVDTSGCPRAGAASTSMLAKRLVGKRDSNAFVLAVGGGIGGVGNAIAMPPVAYFDASEEDATLNEMMGKFDESYVYEKETDILSDSDATNCPSDLDTLDAGDDAEDECDTDELLDIDFIDTNSIQEMPEKRDYNHAFRCSAKVQDVCIENGKTRRSGSSVRRRKRLIKTRKKSTSDNKENMGIHSPLRKSRETRSVGGTPISLRRNAKTSREWNLTRTSLSERASSLVFTHDQGRRYMTVAESNKALLKADMEADFKYRQLIQEAESILVSLKSSAQSLPRETPVCSPRRINPLINKRVEMLKINEIKQPLPIPQQSRSVDMEHDFSAVLNKRIEFLKHESTSAPNSPRSVPRFSPSKTHITNFINQIDGQRKPVVVPNEQPKNNLKQTQNRSPSKVSPLRRRRTTSKSDDTGQNFNHFHSEFESEKFPPNVSSNFAAHKMDVVNHNCSPDSVQEIMHKTTFDDYTNHNLVFEKNINGIDLRTISNKPYYCPQSEPLKRKVYKGSSNFDRFKCNFDFEAERTKLREIQEPWHTQYNMANITPRSVTPKNSTQDLNLNSPLMVNRKQLLLDTLSELKQNLENQSVQLNELNVE